MSVNGTGKDRNGKPLTDSTSWSVKDASGKVLEAEVSNRTTKKREVKTLSGLNATEAFAAVRGFRTKGVFAAAVRS